MLYLIKVNFHAIVLIKKSHAFVPIKDIVVENQEKDFIQPNDLIELEITQPKTDPSQDETEIEDQTRLLHCQLTRYRSRRCWEFT